jgi:hypothetical protein
MFDPQYRNSIAYTLDEWKQQRPVARHMPQQQFENHSSKTVDGNVNSVEMHDLPPSQTFLTSERNEPRRNEKTQEYLVNSLQKAAEQFAMEN